MQCMHPVGSRTLCNAMLTLSSLRRWNRIVLPLLSSSAHVFFSPAKCVTDSSTWRRADQAAAILKKVLRGSAVLQSFSLPASEAVLSEALGSAKRDCFAPMTLRAVMASASCASASKHAI